MDDDVSIKLDRERMEFMRREDQQKHQVSAQNLTPVHALKQGLALYIIVYNVSAVFCLLSTSWRSLAWSVTLGERALPAGYAL
jgi:hypothetical protein